MKKLNWKNIDKIYLISCSSISAEYNSLEECQEILGFDFISKVEQVPYEDFVSYFNYVMSSYCIDDIPDGFFKRKILVDDNFITIPKDILLSNMKKVYKKENKKNFRNGPIPLNGHKRKKCYSTFKEPHRFVGNLPNNVNYRRNTDFLEKDDDLKFFKIKYRKKKMIIEKYHDYNFLNTHRGNNWKNYRKKQYK